MRGEKSINVWSPASTLYKDVFLRDWSARRGGDSPIDREASLALTPMVLVLWDERYQAFQSKYGQADFTSIARFDD